MSTADIPVTGEGTSVGAIHDSTSTSRKSKMTDLQQYIADIRKNILQMREQPQRHGSSRTAGGRGSKGSTKVGSKASYSTKASKSDPIDVSLISDHSDGSRLNSTFESATSTASSRSSVSNVNAVRELFQDRIKQADRILTQREHAAQPAAVTVMEAVPVVGQSSTCSSNVAAGTWNHTNRVIENLRLAGMGMPTKSIESGAAVAKTITVLEESVPCIAGDEGLIWGATTPPDTAPAVERNSSGSHGSGGSAGDRTPSISHRPTSLSRRFIEQLQFVEGVASNKAILPTTSAEAITAMSAAKFSTAAAMTTTSTSMSQTRRADSSSSSSLFGKAKASGYGDDGSVWDSLYQSGLKSLKKKAELYQKKVELERVEQQEELHKFCTFRPAISSLASEMTRKRYMDAHCSTSTHDRCLAPSLTPPPIQAGPVIHPPPPPPRVTAPTSSRVRSSSASASTKPLKPWSNTSSSPKVRAQSPPSRPKPRQDDRATAVAASQGSRYFVEIAYVAPDTGKWTSTLATNPLGRLQNVDTENKAIYRVFTPYSNPSPTCGSAPARPEQQRLAFVEKAATRVAVSSPQDF